MFRLGYDVAVALGVSAGKYEGTYTEDEKGVRIQFKSKEGISVSRFLPSLYFPQDLKLRDKYIAHEIEQTVILLDDKVAQLSNRNAPVGITEVMVHKIGIGGPIL